MYIQLNIGRNIDGVPMSSEKWERFISETKRALVEATLGTSTVEEHRGAGWYGSEPEDSAHLSIINAEQFSEDKLENLVENLKAKYDQDSIAVILGSKLY